MQYSRLVRWLTHIWRETFFLNGGIYPSVQKCKCYLFALRSCFLSSIQQDRTNNFANRATGFIFMWVSFFYRNSFCTTVLGCGHFWVLSCKIHIPVCLVWPSFKIRAEFAIMKTFVSHLNGISKKSVVNIVFVN